MKRFKSFIKKKRERKGFTAEQLAEIIGVNRSYITKIETGNRVPSLAILLQIFIALGVTKEEFDNVYFDKYPRYLLEHFLIKK